MCDLTMTVLFQVVGVCQLVPGLENEPGCDDFAVPGVGNARDGDLGDGRVPVEELFDLGGRDVFAPADDQFPLRPTIR